MGLTYIYILIKFFEFFLALINIINLSNFSTAYQSFYDYNHKLFSA